VLEKEGDSMAAKRKGTVGIVGLGIMGGAFAKNLAAGAWRVVGFDTDAARRKAAARNGATVVDSAQALARAVPTIITSLPSPAALQATVQAIIAADVPSRVVVEASTFALDDKLAAERALRQAGHVMLDCPISGTGSQAKVKDLVVYASGDRKTIARLKPPGSSRCSWASPVPCMMSAPSATAAA
jgi:3-hydroxyisobutyrate dehydrogenase-like beta-hydroxyacid dehydrogenase